MLVVVLLTLSSACWAEGRSRRAASRASVAQPGPVLRVTATIRPQMALEVDADHIRFDVTGPPGEHDAHSPVHITVASNCGQWTVRARATDLGGSAGAALKQRARIPASRLLARSARSDGLGAPEYVPLDTDVVLADGSQQGPSMVTTVFFRLLTQWSDVPGEYEGQVNFTYIADF